jgi:hypothetical protein
MTTTRPAFRFLAVAALACAAVNAAQAQSNPTAQALPYTQDFGTTTFTTAPAGVAVWNGLSGGTINSQALAEGSAPTGNATITAATAAQTGGGAYGYATGGNAQLYIQTSSNASNGVNQPVIAVDTTGKVGITLSYTIDIISAQPRTIGVVAQYRVGTSGSWTTITPTSGSNPYSQAGGTTGLKTTVSASLPTAAENQPVVQIRWAIWRGTESGNSSGLGLDNISVTGTSSGGPAPVVTDFSPASGPAGTAVTIGGSNFTGATSVLFGGVTATFSNVTATNLGATVPSGALTGPISVTTTNGTGLSSSNFLVPTVTVILPLSVNEGASGTGELTVNEAPTNDVTVTLTSSSTNDLTVDTPVTIFASTTNTFFNFSAPPDSTIDGNTNVTVTPSAVGYTGVPDTITVVNVDAVKIPLTNFTTNSYTQDFNSLGTATISNVVSLTNGVQTGLGSAVSTNLNGWYAAKIAGSAGIANIVADNGSGFSGAVYNYGTTGDTNRSLGGLASGSFTPAFGALISNATGTTINSIIINLTGKFWRPSAANTNSLNFAFGVVDGSSVNNNNFLTTVSATNLSSANIVGPVVATTNDQTPLDGNLATNQVLISNVVIPVILAPGETMFFRWQDFDNVSADAGLAIDDLSLTASTNLASPSVSGVTVNQFALTESQSEVSSSVVSEGGSTLTARGFVYSESLFNSNPVIGGSGVTAITNTPPDVSAFTNTISGLLASTAYTVRSFAINAQGTNYSAGTTFNTLAPNPAFSGVYTQNFNGLTNTFFPNGWRCLSTSNVNNYAGDWNATNSTAVGFYGRTNVPGILGYLHGAATGILSNRLTLVNNTGGTLTNLWVSYQGEVNVLNPTSNLRFPEWTVVVQGQTNASLAYSTAGGTNAFLSAEITGLSIPNGSNIVISWSSDRGPGSNSSRLIGMTDVRVATNAPVVTPTINVSGSFTNFLATVGTPSPSQTLTVSGSNLTNNITVSMPFNYQVSTNNTNFSYAAVDLVPSGGIVTNTTLYFRLFATNYVGNANGNLLFDSPSAFEVFPVNGYVNSTFTYWLSGAPSNNANLLKYAIGGATSPTATDGTAPTTAVTSSNLSITAIVRTNDPALDVIGEGLTNLSVGPWSTNGVTQTVSTNQAGVPVGTERQIFSIPRGTNASQFLRLDSILQP